jgi:hypothetical protein
MHSLAELCRVHIELDLSKNLRWKNMFRQPEFHRDIKLCLRQSELELSNQRTNPQGRVISIEVSGSAAGLQFFIDRCLGADTPGGCSRRTERGT